MEKILGAFNGKRKDLNKNQALNWSTYSLVSCPELTPDTLQSWLALPDEVKNDPSLEQIRRKVEEIDASDENQELLRTKPLHHDASVHNIHEDGGNEEEMDESVSKNNYKEKHAHTHTHRGVPF
ncbi:hypothetical protein KGM_202966 [Danaus plexippus plexippus]|uniref:Uncharacterized protein n=1 Tax=Danaus plexippus plexippus TaxID=278856 RepID=A0A212F2Y9_DANPL|nr:hypothetical protein KGM_202966 [Danaus plexippus plexippus]